MLKASVMEQKMVLDMVARSIQAIEEAQRGLEIQHRDLTRQAEWIKEEIRKASHDDSIVPPSFCDRGTWLNQNLPQSLGIGIRVDASLPAGTIEVWQHGQRVGRIENICTR